MAGWKAFIGGEKLGPVDDDTLRQWIAEKRVTPATQVWQPGMAKWAKAQDVPELNGWFSAAAPEPAPAPTPVAAPAPSRPAPAAPARPLVEPARPLYGDDEAATVLQASPFVERVDHEEATKLVSPTPPPQRPAPEPAYQPPAAQPSAGRTLPMTDDVRQAVREAERPAPRAADPYAQAERPQRSQPQRSQPQRVERPGLPLLPFLFSLLALVPAASFGYLWWQGMPLFMEGNVIPYALQIASLAGMGLVLLLPLTFSRFGLVMGIIGSLLWLGAWIGFIVFVPVDAGLDVVEFAKNVYVEQPSAAFQGGDVMQIAMAVLNIGMVVFPLFAFLYYVTTRKYRRRLAA